MALCCARGIGARVACFFPSIAVQCLRYGGSRVLDTHTPRGRTRIVNDRICNWQNRNAKDCKFCGDLACFVLGAVAERVGVRSALIARGASGVVAWCHAIQLEMMPGPLAGANRPGFILR